MLFFSMQAQTTAAFGAKVGWINSKFLGEDADNQNNKSGLSAGVFLNITSGNEIIGFQPELLFSQKGSDFQVGNIREDYRLSYIEVPMLLKVSVPISSLRPNIFAGPYASFKVSETYTYTEVLTGATLTGEDNTKSIDYGAIFGAGLDVNLSSAIITVDGRYNLGLQELEDADEPKDIKNGSFSFNVGIAFKL